MAMNPGDLILLPHKPDFSPFPEEKPVFLIAASLEGGYYLAFPVVLSALKTPSEWEVLLDSAMIETLHPFHEIQIAVSFPSVLPAGQEHQPMGSLKKEALDRVLRKYVQFAAQVHYTQIPPEKSPNIPVAGRVLDQAELYNLIEASLDLWLTTGRFNDSFEEKLKAFLGVEAVATVNSGSSANLIAFRALTSPKLGPRRILPGDEVITVAAAFPTTVAPILQYGAVPVFVDISLPSYNIDCRFLEQALSPKTKAVFLAHTLGNPFDIEKVKGFCESHQLWLIEDTCDALGTRYFYQGKWRYVGTFGDMATLSFYPAHHITMGEGGAVLTSNPLLHRIVLSLRDWGRDCWCKTGKDNTCGNRFGWQLGELPFGYDHKYVYSHFGYNLKITDLQAAVGCAQLEKLPQFILTRQKNWQRLKEGLSDLSDRLILPEATLNSDPAWFGFILTVRDGGGLTRDQLVKRLEANKIQTRMLFAGNILKHPCFDEMRKNQTGYRVIGVLSNTDAVMERAFWVGVYPGLTEEKVNTVLVQIRKAFASIPVAR